MAFTDSQIRKLKSKLKPQHVRVREAEGQALHYLEGWHVVAEANRIFGFDAWDRETVSNACVWTKQVSGRYCAAYVARVRITVRAGEGVVIREGSGAGELNEATPGKRMIEHPRPRKPMPPNAPSRPLATPLGLTSMLACRIPSVAKGTTKRIGPFATCTNPACTNPACTNLSPWWS